jgi:hypothetical protein
MAGGQSIRLPRLEFEQIAWYSGALGALGALAGAGFLPAAAD